MIDETKATKKAVSTPTMESRFRGAILGLACGDALGAPAEFLSQDALKAKYGVLKEMVGGGSFGWAPGETTDDSNYG